MADAARGGRESDSLHIFDEPVGIADDPRTFRRCGIIAVDSKKYPDINYKGAMALCERMTSAGGRTAVADFPRLANGRSYSTPNRDVVTHGLA